MENKDIIALGVLGIGVGFGITLVTRAVRRKKQIEAKIDHELNESRKLRIEIREFLKERGYENVV